LLHVFFQSGIWVRKSIVYNFTKTITDLILTKTKIQCYKLQKKFVGQDSIQC